MNYFLRTPVKYRKFVAHQYSVNGGRRFYCTSNLSPFSEEGIFISFLKITGYMDLLYDKSEQNIPAS